MKSYHFGEPSRQPFPRLHAFMRRIPKPIRICVFGLPLVIFIYGGLFLALALCKAGNLGRRIAHAYGIDSDESF